MIKATSKVKALKHLQEVNDNGKQVHIEVTCYKKVDKNGGVETLKLVCHTEAQIENFYLPRGKKGGNK